MAGVYTLEGPGLDSYVEYTEYGATKSLLSTPERYGWHGTKQRDANTVGGVTLMGVRLYNPTTGRFLSRDPVAGGNDNTYIYPADPINLEDLDGEFRKWAKKKAKKFKNGVKKAGKAIGRAARSAGKFAVRNCHYVPGAVGLACSAVKMGYHVYKGNYRKASQYAAGLTGSGLAGRGMTRLAGGSKNFKSNRAMRFGRGYAKYTVGQASSAAAGGKRKRRR